MAKQVKIFNKGNINVLEAEINQWLTDNGSITNVQITEISKPPYYYGAMFLFDGGSSNSVSHTYCSTFTTTQVGLQQRAATNVNNLPPNTSHYTFVGAGSTISNKQEVIFNISGILIPQQQLDNWDAIGYYNAIIVNDNTHLVCVAYDGGQTNT